MKLKNLMFFFNWFMRIKLSFYIIFDLNFNFNFKNR
jgi:hypothetical protein